MLPIMRPFDLQIAYLVLLVKSVLVCDLEHKPLSELSLTFAPIT